MRVDITYPQGGIANHNADGMCAEETCDRTPNHFFTLQLDDIKMHVELCERHWAAFGNMKSRVEVAPMPTTPTKHHHAN